MNKKPVSVNIDNNFYKKGLVSLLNEIPWIELVPPDHPTVEVVYTDKTIANALEKWQQMK